MYNFLIYFGGQVIASCTSVFWCTKVANVCANHVYAEMCDLLVVLSHSQYFSKKNGWGLAGAPDTITIIYTTKWRKL